jgi:hypothetical protein
MAVASFEDLCAGFCELLKVSPPELKADHRGLIAFHVTLRGAIVNLVHRPLASTEHFFVIFDMGPLGRSGDKAAAEMQTLLEANFNLLQVNPPVFSRNPATGEAVLQYIHPFFEATPASLYELIDKEIDRISHWRENLSTRDTGDGSPVATGRPPLDMLHQFA